MMLAFAAKSFLPDFVVGARWAAPVFLALVPVAIFAWWQVRRRAQRSPTGIRFSAVEPLRALPTTVWMRLAWMPRMMRCAALVLLGLGAAQPQFGANSEVVRTLGVDIILVTDLSESMRFNDLRPNRLEVARQAMKDFVDGRPSDNIGIVAFATQVAMLCPLTPEYDIVRQFIDRLDFRILGEATAIGDGLMLAVRRLERSQAKSKVIVLLTDGKNTAGKADPEQAADVAKALGIIVHTIGIGSNGRNEFFSMNVSTQEFDPEMLTFIAKQTGGRYYHATDSKKFSDIFSEIDQLEKTRLERTVNREFDEKMAWFIVPALAFVLIEGLLRGTRLRRLPD